MKWLQIVLLFCTAACCNSSPIKTSSAKEFREFLQRSTKEVQGLLNGTLPPNTSAVRLNQSADWGNVEWEISCIKKYLTENFSVQTNSSIITIFSHISSRIVKQCENIKETKGAACKTEKMGNRTFAKYVQTFLKHIPFECENMISTN